MAEIGDQYRAKAAALYDLLLEKYQINKGTFTSARLTTVATRLGTRENKITYDEQNKINNIAMKVNWMDETNQRTQVTEDDLHELNNLYANMQTSAANKQDKVSELEILFNKLSMRSKDAIVNENEFDDFKAYMHIERPIEEQFETALQEHLIPKSKSILFVVGNVGDGKSHIISYMQEKLHPDEFAQYDIKVLNDATETDTPTGTALQTIQKKFTPFADANIRNGAADRLIVAINLGVMTNLIAELRRVGGFDMIADYLQDSQVLSSRKLLEKDDSFFRIVSFTEQTNFAVKKGQAGSDFYQAAIHKIYSNAPNNPFYQAYLADNKNGLHKILHTNYGYLMRASFQQAIVYLLTRAEIEYKSIISARILFNFFYDITMPRDRRSDYNSYLPYLLFENKSRSDLLSIVSTMDPIKKHTREMNRVSIELYQAPDPIAKVKTFLRADYEPFEGIFQSFRSEDSKFDNFLNTYLRLAFLLNCQSDLFDDDLYEQYLRCFSMVKTAPEDDQNPLFDTVNAAFINWNGDSGKDGYMIKNPGKGRIKILIEVNLDIEHATTSGSNINLDFNVGDESYPVEIDFRTFEILSKLNNGYFLKEEDHQIATQFELFVNKIVNNINSTHKNLLLDTNTRQYYELKKQMAKIKLKKLAKEGR